MLELRRAQQAFELRRPKEPHAQACWLAGRAGERVGVQLARALMREADNNDWSIYLETQNERTMSFFAAWAAKSLQTASSVSPARR